MSCEVLEKNLLSLHLPALLPGAAGTVVVIHSKKTKIQPIFSKDIVAMETTSCAEKKIRQLYGKRKR